MRRRANFCLTVREEATMKFKLTMLAAALVVSATAAAAQTRGVTKTEITFGI